VAATFPSFDEVQKVRGKLLKIAYEHWVHDDFLTWKWWLLIVLSIVPWLVWIKIIDRERVHEILLYGFFIAICAIALDNIGTDLLWWGYPDKLLPMIPPLFPADWTLVPVILMVVYQFFHTWRSFIVANLVLGAFLAYLAEPVFIWLDFYQLYSWKLTYSYLFYIVTALVGRWLVLKTLSDAQRSRHPGK